MTATETVLLFMERISQHIPENLAQLMTDDHLFVDSLGHSVRGREKMVQAWRSYYEFCPDYWVSHEDVFQNQDRVAVFGSAGGTIAEGGLLLPQNKWRIAAAWLAIVSNGLVKGWRVYADNKPVYDILARRTSK